VEGALARRDAGAVTAAGQPVICIRPEQRPSRGITAPTTLEQIAAELRDTRQERNNSLNRQAFGLAFGGAHEKREARSALLEAAQESGLNAVEADRTFESGWRAGVRARHGQREPTERDALARMSRNALRDRVWDSRLCGKHKLLLLAILKHMNDEDRAWPSVATLAGHCSMSRSTITELLRDLVAGGWIEKGVAHWLTTPGRRPNGYQPPLLAADGDGSPTSTAGRTSRHRGSPGLARDAVSTGSVKFPTPLTPLSLLDRSSCSGVGTQRGLVQVDGSAAESSVTSTIQAITPASACGC
jgi:hypothetical protein